MLLPFILFLTIADPYFGTGSCKKSVRSYVIPRHIATPSNPFLVNVICERYLKAYNSADDLFDHVVYCPLKWHLLDNKAIMYCQICPDLFSVFYLGPYSFRYYLRK